MSTKKARRKERQQRKQEARARGNSKTATKFIVAIVAVIVILVAGALLIGDRPEGRGDPPWPGAVWSPEHGHWH